jgi:O-antigen/teichoic acid export membrane protein
MFLKYVSGQQFSVFIRSLQELMMRILISPAELAVWNLITIIASSVALFQSNMVAASNRLIAQMRGARAKNEQLEKVRGNSIYLEILQQTLLSCGLLLLAPLIWPAPDSIGFLMYYCAAVVMVSNGLIALLVGLHESNNCFGRLGIVLSLNATLQAVTVTVGTYMFGVWGLIGGALLGLILNILVLLGSLQAEKISWQSKPDWSVSKELGTVAISFRFADLPTSMFYLLDTILASFWLSPTALAFYMTARLLINFSTQIVFAVNRMALIQLGHCIGANKSKEENSRYISSQFVLILLFLLPLSIAIFEPAFRWALPVFLNEYTDSLIAVPFLMLASLTSSRTLFIRNYWIHKGQWKKILHSGIWGLFTALLVFLVGKEWFDEIGLREFSILTFISQLPYAIYLIVAVTVSEDVKSHLFYRLKVFFLSFLSIVLCLWFNGALMELPIKSILGLFQNIMASILVLTPFFLIAWWTHRAIIKQ